MKRRSLFNELDGAYLVRRRPLVVGCGWGLRAVATFGAHPSQVCLVEPGCGLSGDTDLGLEGPLDAQRPRRPPSWSELPGTI